METKTWLLSQQPWEKNFKNQKWYHNTILRNGSENMAIFRKILLEGEKLKLFYGNVKNMSTNGNIRLS